MQKKAALSFLIIFYATSFFLLFSMFGSDGSLDGFQRENEESIEVGGIEEKIIEGSPIQESTLTSYTVLVTRVIDGDTIEIEGGVKVRYIGIDTPETVDPRSSVQCYGRQATYKNRELVGGKRVRLEKDISNTDKYGRLLRYIWLEDVLVNEILVKEGYAFSSPYPPDIKYQEKLNSAEKMASERNKGLWGSCEVARLPDGQVAGQKTTQPDTDCVIKGNIASSGEKIYHVPKQRYYNRTVISEEKGERWFCSEDEAVKNGWRKSKI